jgi:WD40 repeat protein
VFSHTDSILSMDINKEKNCIITASLDHTIRIFDLESHYQSVEFTSKDLELPLCVASHPNQAIFAGGFSSGIMRVFDIEKHRVVGEA